MRTGRDIPTANNVSSSEQNVNDYLGSIVQALVEEKGMPEEDARGLLFDCLEVVEEDGDLPPMPDEGAKASLFTAWLEAAEELQFREFVIQFDDE